MAGRPHRVRLVAASLGALALVRCRAAPTGLGDGSDPADAVDGTYLRAATPVPVPVRRADRGRALDTTAIDPRLDGAAHATVLVRVAVAMDARGAREALYGWLRGTPATRMPLADAGGADVARGDEPQGREAVLASYGRVAPSIERTREAAHETPDAGAVHIAVACSTGALARIEARVGGAPGAEGMDVVRDGTGPMSARIVASDALGRTASAREGNASAREGNARRWEGTGKNAGAWKSSHWQHDTA